ncbi:hypothetical protein ZWY2020_041471 [Hordeum vulgare]|nr:hypothetical protein ZWY2020_041471 [Hordeum vulgare]
MAGYLTVYCTQDYNVTLVYYLSHYLVDIVSEKAGRVLKLDKIDEGRNWLGTDVLVFHSWHWWPRSGKDQPWDYMQQGSQVMKDMDRTAAFTKALNTWAGWVDANLVRMCADLEDFQYPLFDEGGGRGLQDTLKVHSRKFLGILHGIDTDTWNPTTDRYLKVQYNAKDLQGKSANKAALREQLNLASAYPSQPLVGCITRLVAQKGVHLIRHAIYKTAELGGQFVLLGSSPVPEIQRECTEDP